MNFRLIANTTSYVLWVEAGFLLLPLLVSVLYGEPWMPFFATAVLCILIGFILQLVPVKKAQPTRPDEPPGNPDDIDPVTTARRSET